MKFEEILELLKLWNGRHPEYHGLAQLVFYSDGLGGLLDGSDNTLPFSFKGETELMYLLTH